MAKLRRKIKFYVTLRKLIKENDITGILLILCTIISLVLANSSIGEAYFNFWDKSLFHIPDNIRLPHSLLHIINDVFMVVFFFLVGLEIKRETISGELSSIKKSIMPIVAAIGGMLVPAIIYLSLNTTSGHSEGWGIPMATDIAFSLGILTLLGKRVPFSLKVFLMALAIIDDLGAIIAIAIFYTDTIHLPYLFGAIGAFIVLISINLFKVKKLTPYIIVAVILWYCLSNAGIHATLAGVLLALTIPIEKINVCIHSIHKPVNFFIMPIFALANTVIIFPADITAALSSQISLGIILGLVIGKPLGIFLFSFIAAKIGIASKPKELKWKHILGIGSIAGIGFTMSIFISMLAFHDYNIETNAKIAILLASLIAGIISFIYLRIICKKPIK